MGITPRWLSALGDELSGEIALKSEQILLAAMSTTTSDVLDGRCMDGRMERSRCTVHLPFTAGNLLL